MRIALVATYTYPLALGLRYISAFLKRRGDDVEMFFMRSKHATAEADFSPGLLADLTERLRGADLIGMSLMTNTFHRARALTEAIRTAGLKTPIIWGGPHPTTACDESLDVADIVCVGEGEHAMLELAETLQMGKDPTCVGGLSFRQNGKTIRNPVTPLPEELDKYPFPDYELNTHWVEAKNHFEPASPDNLRGALHRYRIVTTRGCPYSCAFCNNTAWQQVYEGKGPWVRKRSNENIIQEIEQVRARFPTIQAVNIVDDLFFVRSGADIDEFSRMYRNRINLPLELDAHPNLISLQKVTSLARLPVSLISMGIQSGAPDTLRNIYERTTPIKKIIEGINILADHKIQAEYHYLINNPFESDDTRIETLRFAATHHRGPAILRLFPLQFYPGTPLYDRAREEGIIEQRHEIAYQHTYTGKTHVLGSQYLDIWLRVVLHLRNWGVPSAMVHRLIDCATHPWVRRAIDRRWFVPLAYGLYRVGRFIGRNLTYQTFIRPFRYLRRQPPCEELHRGNGASLPQDTTLATSTADPADPETTVRAPSSAMTTTRHLAVNPKRADE